MGHGLKGWKQLITRNPHFFGNFFFSFGDICFLLPFFTPLLVFFFIFTRSFMFMYAEEIGIFRSPPLLLKRWLG